MRSSIEVSIIQELKETRERKSAACNRIGASLKINMVQRDDGKAVKLRGG